MSFPLKVSQFPVQTAKLQSWNCQAWKFPSWNWQAVFWGTSAEWRKSKQIQPSRKLSNCHHSYSDSCSWTKATVLEIWHSIWFLLTIEQFIRGCCRLTSICDHISCVSSLLFNDYNMQMSWDSQKIHPIWGAQASLSNALHAAFANIVLDQFINGLALYLISSEATVSVNKGRAYYYHANISWHAFNFFSARTIVCQCCLINSQ